MKKKDLYAYGILMAAASFAGFVLENVFVLLSTGQVDNRGMCAPFLLGYGIGLMLIYGILGTPDVPAGWLGKMKSRAAQWVRYAALAFVLVSVGEIGLGFFVEKACGFYYWSYTDLPLHITRYTSVPTSLLFALLITGVMGLAFTPLLNAIRKIPYRVQRALSLVLLSIMLVDFVCGFAYMFRHGGTRLLWRLAF